MRSLSHHTGDAWLLVEISSVSSSSPLGRRPPERSLINKKSISFGGLGNTRSFPHQSVSPEVFTLTKFFAFLSFMSCGTWRKKYLGNDICLDARHSRVIPPHICLSKQVVIPTGYSSSFSFRLHYFAGVISILRIRREKERSSLLMPRGWVNVCRPDRSSRSIFHHLYQKFVSLSLNIVYLSIFIATEGLSICI